jgi:hypothetical protein
MARARWFVDVWDQDDPAVVKMREALALRPTEPPGRPETPEAAPDATTRRERVAALVQRIQAGDLSATATLRQLLLDK